MTRQQRITLEQVRSKKGEALGRMNEILKRIADCPEDDRAGYHSLLASLGHARRDFDTWSTVFDTLDYARQYPGLNPELNENVSEGRYVVAAGDPFIECVQLIGTFEDVKAAHDWASTKGKGMNCNVVKLQHPDDPGWGGRGTSEV